MLSRIPSRVVDSSIYIIIALGGLIGRIGSVGVPDWYYPIIIISTIMIGIRIIIFDVDKLVVLCQIILLGLVVRSTPWYSYPIYGQDRIHQAATNYIINTGGLIPETISYYSNYPATHTFAATFTLITNTPLKVGYFSIGIAVALSLVGVYLYSSEVLKSERAVLLSTLFVSTAAYHIRSGAEPFAQALFTALFPIIVYILYKQTNDRRIIFLLLGLLIFAVSIQNIAPLIIVGALLIMISTDKLCRYFPSSILPRHNSYGTISIVVLFITLVAGIYYYIIAGYFRFQTMRFVWIATEIFGQSETTDSFQDAGVTGIPTVELFGQDLPSFLMWAAPFLSFGAILIFSFYISIDRFTREGSFGGPLVNIIMSLVLLSGFGIVLIGEGPATRAMPLILVLMSPSVGWTLYEFYRHRNWIGKFIVITLLFCVVISGILTPPVAKAELSEDNFRAWMDSEEVAASDFAIDNLEEAHTGSYISGYNLVYNSHQGDMQAENKLVGSFHHSEPDTISIFEQEIYKNENILYLDFFEVAYDLNEPRSNKVYTSGGGSIFTPTND